MRKQEISIPVVIKPMSELDEKESQLYAQALAAAKVAYAPYSKFSVGAAVLLDNGEIVAGSNQENAAYPSGTCAERTALFYANAKYPDAAVLQLLVVAINNGEVTASISPCGSCRQVIAEVAHRFNHPFRVILAGKEEATIIEDCRALLPLTFDGDALTL